MQRVMLTTYDSESLAYDFERMGWEDAEPTKQLCTVSMHKVAKITRKTKHYTLDDGTKYSRTVLRIEFQEGYGRPVEIECYD